MKIYFLSSRPCALKLGGVYYGMTDDFERFAEISPKDNIFAEFIPEGALPVSFFITERLRFDPPEHCEVYLLRDGAAIYARDFPPDDFSLKIVAQERFLENLVTVFKQGPLQISFETAKGFFVSTLPHAFESCRIRFESGLFLIEGKERLAVFTKTGNLVLDERAVGYDVADNTLTAVLPLSDSRGRYARCQWALTEDGCFQTSFTLLKNDEKNAGGEDAEIRAAEELLPYAFFESVLIGADFALMLSDELKEKAEHIRAFLGNFTAVTLTDDIKTCGLVRKKKERLFEVNYFTAETKDGKITDVKG